jgi:hypothetical protein
VAKLGLGHGAPEMQAYFDQISSNEKEINGCLKLVKIFDELEIPEAKNFKKELDQI